MRLIDILSEDPAVVAATGTAPMGQTTTNPAPAQNPAAVAQMQAKAVQDTMKRKSDLQQAIKDKEQELIALRKELATAGTAPSVS